MNRMLGLVILVDLDRLPSISIQILKRQFWESSFIQIKIQNLKQAIKGKSFKWINIVYNHQQQQRVCQVIGSIKIDCPLFIYNQFLRRIPIILYISQNNQADQLKKKSAIKINKEDLKYTSSLEKTILFIDSQLFKQIQTLLKGVDIQIFIMHQSKPCIAIGKLPSYGSICGKNQIKRLHGLELLDKQLNGSNQYFIYINRRFQRQLQKKLSKLGVYPKIIYHQQFQMVIYLFGMKTNITIQYLLANYPECLILQISDMQNIQYRTNQQSLLYFHKELRQEVQIFFQKKKVPLILKQIPDQIQCQLFLKQRQKINIMFTLRKNIYWIKDELPQAFQLFYKVSQIKIRIQDSPNILFHIYVIQDQYFLLNQIQLFYNIKIIVIHDECHKRVKILSQCSHQAQILFILSQQLPQSVIEVNEFPSNLEKQKFSLICYSKDLLKIQKKFTRIIPLQLTYSLILVLTNNFIQSLVLQFQQRLKLSGSRVLQIRPQNLDKYQSQLKNKQAYVFYVKQLQKQVKNMNVLGSLINQVDPIKVELSDQCQIRMFPFQSGRTYHFYTHSKLLNMCLQYIKKIDLINFSINLIDPSIQFPFKIKKKLRPALSYQHKMTQVKGKTATTIKQLNQRVTEKYKIVYFGQIVQTGNQDYVENLQQLLQYLQHNKVNAIKCFSSQKQKIEILLNQHKICNVQVFAIKFASTKSVSNDDLQDICQSIQFTKCSSKRLSVICQSLVRQVSPASRIILIGIGVSKGLSDLIRDLALQYPDQVRSSSIENLNLRNKARLIFIFQDSQKRKLIKIYNKFKDQDAIIIIHAPTTLQYKRFFDNCLSLKMVQSQWQVIREFLIKSIGPIIQQPSIVKEIKIKTSLLRIFYVQEQRQVFQSMLKLISQEFPNNLILRPVRSPKDVAFMSNSQRKYSIFIFTQFIFNLFNSILSDFQPVIMLILAKYPSDFQVFLDSQLHGAFVNLQDLRKKIRTIIDFKPQPCLRRGIIKKYSGLKVFFYRPCEQLVKLSKIIEKQLDTVISLTIRSMDQVQSESILVLSFNNYNYLPNLNNLLFSGINILIYHIAPCQVKFKFLMDHRIKLVSSQLPEIQNQIKRSLNIQSSFAIQSKLKLFSHVSILLHLGQTNLIEFLKSRYPQQIQISQNQDDLPKKISFFRPQLIIVTQSKHLSSLIQFSIQTLRFSIYTKLPSSFRQITDPRFVGAFNQISFSQTIVKSVLAACTHSTIKLQNRLRKKRLFRLYQIGMLGLPCAQIISQINKLNSPKCLKTCSLVIVGQSYLDYLLSIESQIQIIIFCRQPSDFQHLFQLNNRVILLTNQLTILKQQIIKLIMPQQKTYVIAKSIKIQKPYMILAFKFKHQEILKQISMKCMQQVRNSFQIQILIKKGQVILLSQLKYLKILAQFPRKYKKKKDIPIILLTSKTQNISINQIDIESVVLLTSSPNQLIEYIKYIGD